MALGFCMSSRDIARLRAFADASRRWQHNPDFRQVTSEYVTLGAEAMLTRGEESSRNGGKVRVPAVAVRNPPGALMVVNPSVLVPADVTMPLAPTFWAKTFGMLTDRFGIQWMVNVAAEQSK